MNFSSCEVQRPSVSSRPEFWTVLIAVLVTAMVLRVLAIIVFPGIHHPDEEFQMLEQAHRFAFGYGVIPWEFEEGVRSPLPPLAISGLFRLAELFGDGPRIYIATARFVLAAVSLLSVVALFFMGLRRSLTHAAIISVVAATWFELVYFSYRPLSEAMSVDFLLVAISIASYRSADISRWTAFIFGVCLAVAVLLRIQFAIGSLILIVWVAGHKEFRRQWLSSVSGALLPIAAFGLADWIDWGIPFVSYFNAIRVNLFQGVASNYGVQPPAWYFTHAVLLYSGVIVVLGSLLLVPNREAALWISIGAAIVLFHSAIPHKEYRFAFGGFACLIVAAAVNSAELSIKLSKTLKIDEWKVVATTATIWILTSACLACGPGFASVWTRNQLSVQAAIALSDRRDLCGLFLYKLPATGYVFIHHNIPIYMSYYNHINLAPEEGAVVEPDWASFNYVMAPRRSVQRFVPKFQIQTCIGGGDEFDPCVLRRSNSCADTAQMVPLLSEHQFGKHAGDVWNMGR
jgi:hypothetical protein